MTDGGKGGGGGGIGAVLGDPLNSGRTARKTSSQTVMSSLSAQLGGMPALSGSAGVGSDREAILELVRNEDRDVYDADRGDEVNEDHIDDGSGPRLGSSLTALDILETAKDTPGGLGLMSAGSGGEAGMGIYGIGAALATDLVPIVAEASIEYSAIDDPDHFEAFDIDLE